MAVKIIKGDLLNCGADIICHQTNFFGMMGSVQMLTHHGKPYVANLFSQMAEPDKFDSLTDYRKLRRCLHEVKMFAKRLHGGDARISRLRHCWW